MKKMTEWDNVCWVFVEVAITLAVVKARLWPSKKRVAVDEPLLHSIPFLFF